MSKHELDAAIAQLTQLRAILEQAMFNRDDQAAEKVESAARSISRAIYALEDAVYWTK